MYLLHKAYRDFTDLPPLNEDEKRNPFAKFYYVPVELPSEEILEAISIDRQMDPAKAMPITDIKSMFIPGYQEVENGYCLMPDGTGYSAVKIDLPDVSLPEFMYLMEYGHENNLQYKTWLPKLHLQQGAYTIEDFGWGPLLFHQKEDLVLSTISEKTLGIDHPAELDPNFISLVGGSLYTIDVLTGQRNDITMITYVRHKGAGLELRVRVWDGLHLVQNQPVRKIPDGEAFPPDKICAIVSHNAFEWTRANTIAHDVYMLKQKLDQERMIAEAAKNYQLDPALKGSYRADVPHPTGTQKMELILHVDQNILTGTVSFMGDTAPIQNGRATEGGFYFDYTLKNAMGMITIKITGRKDQDNQLICDMQNPMGIVSFRAYCI